MTEAPEAAPRGRTGRDLPVAIITGLLLAGGLLGTLFTSRLGFFLFISFFIILAQAEFYRALRAAGSDPHGGIGLVVGGLILLGAYHRGLAGIAFGLAVTLPACALWVAADPQRNPDVARGLGLTVFGVLWIPFLASHLVLLASFDDGPALALLIIGLTVFYDIGAYAVGVAIGKTPIAPTVSPKKSVEGAIGATVIIGVLAVVVGPLITDLPRATLLLLAGVTAIVAPLGDLSESLIKRDLKIKDMGTILPGHGGILDRIDALLLAIPVCTWVIRWALR